VSSVAVVLTDGLGSFSDSMLCQLASDDELSTMEGKVSPGEHG